MVHSTDRRRLVPPVPAKTTALRAGERSGKTRRGIRAPKSYHSIDSAHRHIGTHWLHTDLQRGRQSQRSKNRSLRSGRTPVRSNVTSLFSILLKDLYRKLIGPFGFFFLMESPAETVKWLTLCFEDLARIMCNIPFNVRLV